MIRWRVLISAPYLIPVLDRFRARLEDVGCELIVPEVHERLSESELLGLINGVDGVICGDDRFTEKVLRQADRLKVIAKWGTGIDSIDQAACAQLGIAVRNTPNAFSEPVADSVLGYILAFARRQPWMDRDLHEGKWEKLPGRALSECTLGVIGVGNVGRAVIRRASAFGIRILGNDPVLPTTEFIEQYCTQMVTLPELLAQADFISVNCDLNPTSYHLFSDVQFSIMQPHSVVINTARGPIIDEPALVRALGANRIGGAALDVFEIEPLPYDSPLLGFPNVLLAPHNSNSSPTAWERVHENTIRNLLEGLR